MPPRITVVDVFNWVAVTAQRPDIVMRGIYRHAYALAKEFTPVYYLTAQESESLGIEFVKAHIKLEALLGKRILRFTDDFPEAIPECAKAWISIGLDNVSPILPFLKGKVKRIAVLHDTMSYRKVFGPECEARFYFGNEHNDVILPVSDSTLADYRSLGAQGLRQISSRVRYGCFHLYPSMPVVQPRVFSASGSISTIEPRKRIVATVETALAMGYSPHHHIGAFEAVENQEHFDALNATGRFRWHRNCSDAEMFDTIQKWSAFFCLSSDEGFSMTPMEAILHGVPFVFLSDIPAHREVYGECDVNFLRLGEVPSAPFPDYKQIEEVDREHLFKRWNWKSVSSPLKNYLSFLE